MIVSQTPTTIVTGFLGAGKTSFINEYIKNFGQDNQKIALLVNEIGQIGIDGKLIQKDGLVIKQISGGCICCSSQLPLQVALSQLLTLNLHRLIIEPTGLVNTYDLLTMLSEPHWQTSLNINSIIGIVNYKQWQSPKYKNHPNYQTHIKYSDVVIVNRFDDKNAITDWIKSINNNTTVLFQKESGFDDELGKQINATIHQKTNFKNATIKPLIYLKQPKTSNQTANDNKQLPYRYHQKLSETLFVIGWQLPKQWQVDIAHLTNFLLTLTDWIRIKGVINTLGGFYAINFCEDSLDMKTASKQSDNRIEVIYRHDNFCDEDFYQIDCTLLSLFMQSDAN